MGTDIGGAIERRSADGRRHMEADLPGFRPSRDHVAWECLFGVRGTGDVERTRFADRDLPDDASDAVRETGVGDRRHGHTHVTWAEVAVVDWDAPPASRPAWYRAHRPVTLTARMLATPGEGCRARIRRAMRELANGHDDEGVRLVVRFG